MRHWSPSPAPAVDLVADLVGGLGLPGFEGRLLDRLRAVVPAASCSVYRTGRRPALLMSGSLGVPDTTRDCWRAYLSGPHRDDRSLQPQAPEPVISAGRPIVCHITAGEVAREHRARVYEAHGVAERVSIVDRLDGEDLFAVNFYRHAHQRPFSDTQLDGFGGVAPALLALARKHLALAAPPPAPREQLQARCPALTPRELDVCERLLAGLTHDGIAADLGLSVPTVKTYRNRAFTRLGIHFRSELHALLHGSGA